jgi:hypothetical protein
MENTSCVPSPDSTIRPTRLWRRRYWLVCVASLVLAILFVKNYVFRLKLENVWKIQVGMTQKEVEQLLGGPPGMYSFHGDAVVTFVSIVDIASGNVERTAQVWTGEDVEIRVWFANNEVCEAPTISPHPASLRDRILNWILRPINI